MRRPLGIAPEGRRDGDRMGNGRLGSTQASNLKRRLFTLWNRGDVPRSSGARCALSLSHRLHLRDSHAIVRSVTSAQAGTTKLGTLVHRHPKEVPEQILTA